MTAPGIGEQGQRRNLRNWACGKKQGISGWKRASEQTSANGGSMTARRAMPETRRIEYLGYRKTHL